MYIVTGGAGFIGSAFIAHLNSMGIDDILVVDSLGTSEKWKNLVNRRYMDYIQKSDFIEIIARDRVPEPVTALIHMGACSSTTERNVDYLMKNNTRYTQTLAKWALEHGVRFVYASSAATYGDGSAGYADDDETTRRLKPLNAYGFSKQVFDLWSLKAGLDSKMAGLKFFNVYGPNEYHKGDMSSVIYKAYNQIRETGRVRLFKSYRKEFADGEQVRDFIYVKDCIDVIWWFVQNGNVNGIFNLGTGRARTWKDLVNAVFRAMEKTPVIDYIDMPLSIRDRYQYHTEAVMTRLREAGYESPFRSLEDGVTDYVRNHLAGIDPYL